MHVNYVFLLLITVALIGSVGSVVADPAAQQSGQSAPAEFSANDLAVAALDILAGMSGPEGTEETASVFLPPGHGGTPPGQGGTPPGQTTPPGQGGTPPGQGGTAPGQGGGTPPGQQGQDDTPPSQGNGRG